MARRRRSRTMHGIENVRPATPQEHWKQLSRGDRVRIQLASGFVASGLVDAVTSDHSVVWVDLDGGRGRMLVHCADGVEIIPEGV